MCASTLQGKSFSFFFFVPFIVVLSRRCPVPFRPAASDQKGASPKRATWKGSWSSSSSKKGDNNLQEKEFHANANLYSPGCWCLESFSLAKYCDALCPGYGLWSWMWQVFQWIRRQSINYLPRRVPPGEKSWWFRTFGPGKTYVFKWTLIKLDRKFFFLLLRPFLLMIPSCTVLVVVGSSIWRRTIRMGTGFSRRKVTYEWVLFGDVLEGSSLIRCQNLSARVKN